MSKVDFFPPRLLLGSVKNYLTTLKNLLLGQIGRIKIYGIYAQINEMLHLHVAL